MTGLSRRRALLGGLTFAAAAACASRPVLADPAEPVRSIDERIAALERRHNSDVGLFAIDLDSGRSISHRGQQAFAMCSTFKGYAAARVLQMVEDGELTLGHPPSPRSPAASGIRAPGWTAGKRR